LILGVRFHWGIDEDMYGDVNLGMPRFTGDAKTWGFERTFEQIEKDVKEQMWQIKTYHS
jgi:hypothetical protein